MKKFPDGVTCGVRNIYLQYTVQKGDRLWDLLEKTEMTMGEWFCVNGRDKNPEEAVRPGRKIFIKDPIATCKAADDYADRATEMFQWFGGRNVDPCEDIVNYSAFKPLRAFTKTLEKK